MNNLTIVSNCSMDNPFKWNYISKVLQKKVIKISKMKSDLLSFISNVCSKIELNNSQNEIKNFKRGKNMIFFIHIIAIQYKLFKVFV